MHGYTLVPQCRICSRVDQDVRDAIDADLISGELVQTILLKFKDKFPSEHPLTEASIANHKKHLMEWLAVSKLSAIRVEAGKLSLVPEVVDRRHEVDTFLEKTSLDVARGIVNQDDILQSLIIDSYRDIEKLNEEISSSSMTPKYMRMMVLTKDTVKKNLIDAIQRSQELRQKVGGDIDKATAVKDAIKRVINCCVKSLRAISATQEEADTFAAALKDFMLKDPTLAKYLDEL
jgi:hypothetical protein